MLSRWDPFTELSRLQDQMFRSISGERGGDAPALAFRPAVDIVEEKNGILLKAELPGVKAEDVHVEVEKNVLTIRGERKAEHKIERDGFYRFERSSGSFARSFVLPETVDGGGIDADLTDGVLTVKLPKKATEAPRKISVRATSSTKSVSPGGTA